MTQPLPDPILGLDEAWAKADPQHAKDSGYHFIVGYISQDTSGKNLTRAEIDAIHAADLDIALVFEYNPQSATGGGYAGTQDATIAVQKARELGAPRGMAIYFAIDFPVGTESALQLVDSYMLAARHVCEAAGYEVGAYAGIVPLTRLLDRGLVKYGWQTYAWSNGQWDPRAVLRQVLNGVTVAGADVDKDLAIWPDFGQWRPDGGVGSGETMAFMDDANAAALAWRMDALQKGLPVVEDGPAKDEPMWAVTALQTLLDRTDPTKAPAPAQPSPPEQQLLDLWGRIASALEEIAVAQAGQHGAAVANAAASLDMSKPETLPLSVLAAGIPPTPAAATQPNGAPVDTQA